MADAVGLQEGDAGVVNVLRALRDLDVSSTKAVSRRTGLPVPVVAAVNNELRARGVVTTQRPSQLTPRGRELLDEYGPDLKEGATCPGCEGHGVVLPAKLEPVVERLAGYLERAPEVDLSLDQSFATAETKVRRVLLMMRYSMLPSRSLLVVGDDDLMAITIAATGAALGRPLVSRLAVVDISPRLLDFIEDGLSDLDTRAELVEHDLRQPLPDRLRAGFDVAMTDPPYTPEGARLFLSRAVEGLRPGPGRSIAFSFGPKGPDDTLLVQRAVTDLGLTVQAMHRNFNEYLGAGVIGGTSHLQVLSSTAATESVVAGTHAGPLYTADWRTADREYECMQCGTRYVVGRGGQFPMIGALKEAGCPQCDGHRFRPLQLVRPTGEQPAR
ncbi:MAG: bis-aminopropyl spermidine synthase family protein [Actinocatenispora sp.]